MNEWTLILGMVAVTVLVRYPILALAGRVDLPRPVNPGAALRTRGGAHRDQHTGDRGA